MTNPSADKPKIDYDHHRVVWEEERASLEAGEMPTDFTIRAKVDLVQDSFKEARVGRHRFESDERVPRGEDRAPNPLGYFLAAVGF